MTFWSAGSASSAFSNRVSRTSRAWREQAGRDIAAIVKYLRSQPGRPTDNAQRAVRAVRMAIKRFYQNLRIAVDERERRNEVLAGFAEHLYEHLLIPSARYSSPRARQARGELAGCFVYERPAGKRWILELGN